MKKLSIEEKAKRFDEILARAEGVNILYYKEDIMSKVKEFVYYLLPELKESEDEKLRKCTISLLKTARDKGFYELPKAVNKCIAWLEKQGEHANFRNKIQIGDKVTRNENGVLVNMSQLKRVAKKDEKYGEAFTKKDVDDAYLKGVTDTKNEIEKQYEETYQIRKDIATFIFNYRGDIKDRAKWMGYLGVKVSFFEKQDEQKPADKVETKFKDNDWVTSDGESVFRITIDNNMYQLETLEGTSCHFSYKIIEEKFRLWTIADAKIGDVLVSESTCGLGTWYCIFKSLDNDESMTVHCYIARDGSFQTMEELCFNKDPRNVKPATKEQHDLLFKKMHEAGYKWNIDKKKLEKNEIKIKAGRNYRCTKTHVYAGLNWFEGTKYYANEDYSLVNNRCACFCSKYSKYEHNNLFEEVE